MSVLCLLLAYGWGCSSKILAVLVLFLFGVISAMRTDSLRREILDRNAGVYGPVPTLVVKVNGPPHIGREAKQGCYAVSFPSCIGPIPLDVRIRVPSGGLFPSPGETWECRGWISRKKDDTVRPFVRRTLWTGDVRRTHMISPADAFSVAAWYTAVATDLSKRVTAGLDWSPEIAHLNQAILLGRRTELSFRQRTLFAAAGTIHVFAISGLHVGLIAELLCWLLRRLDVEEPARGLTVIPIIAAYVMLTGARPSAVRAAVMVTLCLLGPVFGRRPDGVSAWSLTALGVYGLNPERLYDVGCGFSFAVMLGIVFWVRWIGKFTSPFEAISDEAKIILTAGMPDRAMKFQKIRVWLEKRMSSVGVSVAAWIAGVPIAASMFERVTPGGLLANLVVLLFAKWMVRFGIIGVCTGLICLPLGAIFNNLSALFTWGMMVVSEEVAKLPYASLTVRPWTVPECIGWYTGWVIMFWIMGVVLPKRGSESRKWW